MDWLRLSPEELAAAGLSSRFRYGQRSRLPLGVPIAMVLARGRFWGRSLLNGIVYMRSCFPPVVTGYILLILFGRRGVIGAFLAEQFGIVLAFRWTGAALACGIMGFPLMVRAIRLSIEGVDRRLEAAAGTLGANPVWVFATVTLPLIGPGVIAGMVLAFAKAMGEFGATITFVSNIPGEPDAAAIYTFIKCRWRLPGHAPDPDLDRDLDVRHHRIQYLRRAGSSSSNDRSRRRPSLRRLSSSRRL
jgi:molybdate transport system permease protein